MKVQLQHVAHTRSGDKGNTSNIAVFAYEPEFYPLLKDQLSAARFKAFYKGAIKGEVLRYEVVPGSGTEGLTGLVGPVDLVVEEDGTHRVTLHAG